MRKTTRIQPLSGILCIALLAAAAFGCSGCASDKPAPTGEQTLLYSPSDTPYHLGDGDTTFPLTVVHLDETSVEFEISTSKSTVGEALEEVGLVTGEEGPFGIMITTVNGQRVVYEEDKAYWAFYIDGTYALSGADTTSIEPASNYELRAEGA